MKGLNVSVVIIALSLTACAAPTPREGLTDVVDIAIMSQADYIYGEPHPVEPRATRRCDDCDERRYAMSHSRLTEQEAAARRDQLTSDLFEYLSADMVSYSAHSCVIEYRIPYETSAVLRERFDALLGPVAED